MNRRAFLTGVAAAALLPASVFAAATDLWRRYADGQSFAFGPIGHMRVGDVIMTPDYVVFDGSRFLGVVTDVRKDDDGVTIATVALNGCAQWPS